MEIPYSTGRFVLGTFLQACDPHASFSLSLFFFSHFPVSLTYLFRPCSIRPTLYPAKVYVIAGVYRLWVCTGGDLDDLGIASIHKEYNGGRDFWFERRHLSSRICEFEEASRGSDGNAGLGLNLTFGAIPYDPDVSENEVPPSLFSRQVFFAGIHGTRQFEGQRQQRGMGAEKYCRSRLTGDLRCFSLEHEVREIVHPTAVGC